MEDLSPYLPGGITQIISGGAKGIDACAKAYAEEHRIPCLEMLPDYSHYRKNAPLKRNELIADQANLVIALWDGVSRGTAYTINYCRKNGIPVEVHLISLG